MDDYVMYEIKGGSGAGYGTLINALARVFGLVLEIGRAIGSSISRYKSGSRCY